MKELITAAFAALELATGTVESVREVPRDIHAFDEAIEHSVNPQRRDELVIRLDDGLVLSHAQADDAHRFAPGERVRVVAGRVERE